MIPRIATLNLEQDHKCCEARWALGLVRLKQVDGAGGEQRKDQ